MNHFRLRFDFGISIDDDYKQFISTTTCFIFRGSNQVNSYANTLIFLVFLPHWEKTGKPFSKA